MNTTPLRMILVLSCLIFLALGVITAALGPVLPELAAQAGTDLTGIGAIFTGIFFGALLSQLVSGPMIDRIGQRAVLAGGVVLLACGTLALTWSRTLSFTLALAFVAGLGHGAVDMGANLWIATAYNNRSVSALNLLNFFFGVGAFAGPTLASLSLTWLDTGLPSLWISAGLLFILLPFLFLVKSGRSQTAGSKFPPDEPTGWIYRAPLLWGMGAIVLLYVGTETGMGGWTTTYVEQTLRVSIESAALVTAGFWLALTAGRMTSAALGLRITPRRLLAASLAGAVIGGIILVLGLGNLALTIAGVLLIGFCFGPVYPTMVAVTTATFPSGPGKAVSITAASGSVGGMAMPWLQGVLLNRAGPAFSSVFTLVGEMAMLLFAAGILYRMRRTQQTSVQVDVPRM
jgi:fucose permease